MAEIFCRNLNYNIMGIKWYLQYAWVKLNIWFLTPIVWVQSKYNAYKEWRLRAYVNYQIMVEQSKTNN